MTDPRPFPDYPRPGPLQGAAAVLGVLVVLGAALAVLGRPDAYVKSEAASTLEGRLAGSGPDGPEVVVLGNSKALFDVNRAALARALRLPEAEVVQLTVAASGAPTWFAVLKNRIYANGYRPRLVVVCHTFGFLLESEGRLSPGDRQRLLEQMGPDEPVIDAKLFGRTSFFPPLRRALDRRVATKARVVDGARNLGLGLFLPEAAATPEQAEEALSRVFDAAAIDATEAPSRVIPVVEREEPKRAEGRIREVDETFVPDLVSLAQEHGTRLVFVRLPLPVDSGIDAEVRPEEAAAVVASVNATDAGWVDLTDTPIGGAAFRDLVHLNPRGAAEITRRLGALLVEMDALGSTRFPDAAAPVLARRAPRLVRDEMALDLPGLRAERLNPRKTACAWKIPLPDEMAAFSDGRLKELGLRGQSPLGVRVGEAALEHGFSGGMVGKERCDGSFQHREDGIRISPAGEGEPTSLSLYVPRLDGDASATAAGGWWVPPGGSLRIELDPTEGALQGQVSVLALGLGEGEAVPTASVGGVVAPFSGVEGLYRATIPAGEPSSSIEVRVPRDGPFLLLIDAAVEEAKGERSLLAAYAGENAAWRFFGGRLRDVVSVSFSGPPERPADLPSAVARGAGGFFDDSGAVSMAQIREVRQGAGLESCRPRPLVVLDGAAPLPHPERKCAGKPAPGTWCAARKGVWFGPPEGGPPSDAGRFTLALDPDRSCLFSWWLYPGDAMEASTTATQWVPRGADDLELALAVPSEVPDGAALQVELRIDGEPWTVASVPLGRFREGMVDLPIEPTLDRRPGELVVRLATGPDAPFVAITSIVLRRRNIAAEEPR